MNTEKELKKSKDYAQTKQYCRNDEVALVDTTFVYESAVYLRSKNYFSLINKSFFRSRIELPVVSSFYKTHNVEICCTLYAAPEKWLIDNGFIEYKTPEKKTKKKKENGIENKQTN